MNLNLKQDLKESLKLMSICFLTSVITILLFFLLLKFALSQSFENELSYHFIINDNNIMLDSHVLNVSKTCINSDPMTEIICVNNYFIKRFNYKLRNESNIKTPTQMFKDGGLCRDSVVFYCAVMKKFNLPCRVEYVDNHVFSLVDLKNGKYCILDQEIIICI